MTDDAYLRAATHVIRARHAKGTAAELIVAEQVYAARLAGQIEDEFARNPPPPLRLEQIVALRAIISGAAAEQADKVI